MMRHMQRASHALPFVLDHAVHSYERTHPVYNWQVNSSGPVYLLMGDGGGAWTLPPIPPFFMGPRFLSIAHRVSAPAGDEGLTRAFIDGIDPYTNQSFCLNARGANFSVPGSKDTVFHNNVRRVGGFVCARHVSDSNPRGFVVPSSPGMWQKSATFRTRSTSTCPRPCPGCSARCDAQ